MSPLGTGVQRSSLRAIIPGSPNMRPSRHANATIVSAQIAVTKTVGNGSDSSPNQTAVCVALTHPMMVPITTAQPIALCFRLTAMFGLSSGGSTLQCSPATISPSPTAALAEASSASELLAGAIDAAAGTAVPTGTATESSTTSAARSRTRSAIVVPQRRHTPAHRMCVG